MGARAESEASLLELDIISVVAAVMTILSCTGTALTLFPAGIVMVHIVFFPLATSVGAYVMQGWFLRRNAFRREMTFHARHVQPGRVTRFLLPAMVIVPGIAALVMIRREHDLHTAQIVLTGIMAAAGARLKDVTVMSDGNNPLSRP